MNQGFTIIQPNFRGSTGYGKSFQRRIYQDWGGLHIEDLMAARQYLVSQLGYSDKKIAIMGGSFGGYSSAEAISQKPKDFCAASVEYAVLDIVDHISGSTTYYKKSQHETIGNPEKNLEQLKSNSPMFKVDQLQTPILVVYGQKDKIVSSDQSEKYVKLLEQKNKTHQVIVYDNEGHGVSGYSNFQFYQKEISSFFAKHCQKP